MPQAWAKMNVRKISKSHSDFSVIGFGALNYDRILFVEKLARRGEHQPIIKLYGSPGGSAANTIAGLSRLGFKTGFIGAVGDDLEGKLILREFGDYYVDCSRIRKMRGQTGMILCFVENTGERTMYPYPGVNDDVRLKQEDVRFANGADFLHISSFVNPVQFKEQIRLIKKLDDVSISFSPGDLYVRLGLDVLKPIIKKTSFLFMNRTEIEDLTDRSYTKGCKLLLDMGIETVTITLGKKGCYIASRDGEVHVRGYKTEMVDTTGAGDAFAAGFLAGVLSDKDIRYCGKLGNKLAASCISRFGARDGLPIEKI